MRKIIVLLSCLLFVGCLSAIYDLQDHVLAEGIVKYAVHVPETATIVIFEGSDKMWQCDYAPWVSTDNWQRIIKTEKGCKIR